MIKGDFERGDFEMTSEEHLRRLSSLPTVIPSHGHTISRLLIYRSLGGLGLGLRKWKKKMSPQWCTVCASSMHCAYDGDRSIDPSIYTSIQYMAWHSMPWCGMVWHGMVWCGMAWHGMHGTLRYGMIWYDMVWCGTVRYGTDDRNCSRRELFFIVR